MKKFKSRKTGTTTQLRQRHSPSPTKKPNPTTPSTRHRKRRRRSYHIGDPVLIFKNLSPSPPSSQTSEEILKEFFEQLNKYKIAPEVKIKYINEFKRSSILISHIYNVLNSNIGVNDSWVVFEIFDLMKILNKFKKNLYYLDIIEKCARIKKASYKIIAGIKGIRSQRDHTEWFHSIRHFFGGFAGSSGSVYLADPIVVGFFEEFVGYIRCDCLDRKEVVS